MLRNYLTIAFRNLTRNKVYSLINILGLSLGITCCILLTLYIADEVSYDKQHPQLNDLYRIISEFQGERGLDRLATTSPPIAMAMRDEIPEVENAVRIFNPPGVALSLIRYRDNMFYEPDGYFSDSTLFDIFNYQLLEGNPKKALVEASSIVLSEPLARKLFGNEAALDKVLTIIQGGSPRDFKVTGVFRQAGNSHLNPRFIISMTSPGWGEYVRTQGATQWAGNNFLPAYLKLVPGHDLAVVEAKMNDVLMKHGAEALKAMGMKKTLHLQRMSDIHLYNDVGESPRITYVYVIATIAAFILLIACINFMNLSTAKASKRATEMGIRKVMGAFRSSLMKQVLGEAMVIVAISIIIGVGLVQLSLPFFNNVTGKSIVLTSTSMAYGAAALLLLAVITGLLAGAYPAMYLSSFQPAHVLKGKSVLSNSRGWLRQSLVVVQFIIAIALVCGMLTISSQLKYIQEKDLGFTAKARVALPLRTATARQAYPTLKKELEKNSHISAVSGAEYLPGSMIWSDMLFYPDGGTMETAVLLRRNTVDAGFLEQLAIKLIAGRSFTESEARDSTKTRIIVNRAAAKSLGFGPEEIVGRQLYFDWEGRKYIHEVIGVMEDYHQQSLKDAIVPTLFEMPREAPTFGNLVLTLNMADLGSTLSELETTWKASISDTPFEYAFLDDAVRKLYDDDRRVSSVITAFTLIAMAICCLGLYGLSSFMAERRFKEIGIRKVMGASLTQIASMMSMEFVRLVIIAFVISAPIAWYAMNRWLETFQYHTSVEPTIFVIAGLAALAIALATISFESLRAAAANPVQSLRNE